MTAHTTAGTSGQNLLDARKLKSNKAVIREDGLFVTIYDDDDTTSVFLEQMKVFYIGIQVKNII